jgi:signal transduction histidine kinase
MPWAGVPGAAFAVLRAEAHVGISREVAERRTRFESLGRLASNVAHDFNNLLTGIRGSLALIRNGASEQSRTRALNSAEAAAQRAGEMIRQLLARPRQHAWIWSSMRPSNWLAAWGVRPRFA